MCSPPPPLPACIGPVEFGEPGRMACRLAESGADVTFLVREGRRKSLIDDGLRIESSFGNASLAVKTVMSAQVEPVYDAILLTCKAYDLDAVDDLVADVFKICSRNPVAFVGTNSAAQEAITRYNDHSEFLTKR